jgi:hypothetical protein
MQATTLYSLGRMLLKEHHFDEAEPLLRNAVSLFEHLHGPAHCRVAYGYITLAACLAGRPTGARKGTAVVYLDKATRILMNRGKKVDTAEFGGSLPVKSKVLQMMGQHKRALSIMNQVHPRIQLSVYVAARTACHMRGLAN